MGIYICICKYIYICIYICVYQYNYILSSPSHVGFWYVRGRLRFPATLCALIWDLLLGRPGQPWTFFCVLWWCPVSRSLPDSAFCIHMRDSSCEHDVGRVAATRALLHSVDERSSSESPGDDDAAIVQAFVSSRDSTQYAWALPSADEWTIDQLNAWLGSTLG